MSNLSVSVWEGNSGTKNPEISFDTPFGLSILRTTTFGLGVKVFIKNELICDPDIKFLSNVKNNVLEGFCTGELTSVIIYDWFSSAENLIWSPRFIIKGW